MMLQKSAGLYKCWLNDNMLASLQGILKLSLSGVAILHGHSTNVNKMHVMNNYRALAEMTEVQPLIS